MLMVPDREMPPLAVVRPAASLTFKLVPLMAAATSIRLSAKSSSVPAPAALMALLTRMLPVPVLAPKVFTATLLAGPLLASVVMVTVVPPVRAAPSVVAETLLV